MKNKELLEKSLGYIGDDLISEAKPPKSIAQIITKKRTRSFTYIGAAATILILITLILSVGLFIKEPPKSTSPKSLTAPPFTYIIPDTADQILLPAIENFWEFDNFRSFTLSYQNSVDSQNGSLNAVDSPVLSTTKDYIPTDISINIDNAISIESIIANRYIAYYSPEGTPMFYDTVENKEVDLEKMILGDMVINDYVLSFAYKKAEEMLPGCTKNNKEFFEEFIITYSIKKRTELFSFNYSWDDLDLSFFDELGEEYKALTDKEKRIEVWYAYQDGYTAIASKVHNGNPESDILNDYSYISIMGIDSRNGTCYYAELDLRSQAKGFYKYDISKDESTPFVKLNNENEGIVLNFSEDGSIVTIASPIIESGPVVPSTRFDVLYRKNIENSSTTDIRGYNGEKVRAIKYDSNGELVWSTANSSQHPAASEIFVSSDNNIIYYKKWTLTARNLYSSRLVWYNRLDLYNGENDSWVFKTVVGEQKGSTLVFNGNFVRLIADNTAVIMRRKGEIKVYSLIDGSEITEQASKGSLEGMKAHERYEVVLYNKDLYKKDIFTGEVIPFWENVDKYFISSDNAFAFVHEIGDDAITCINIANLEKCRVRLTKEIFDAIMQGAELNITYKKQDNTLLISYCHTDGSSLSSNSTGIDFYYCLTYGKSIDATRNIDTNYTPTVVTEYTLSESALNRFRSSAEKILNWGYKNDKYREDDDFNPCHISYHDSVQEVFEKLEIDIEDKDIYQDDYLTKFVLYEDDDEQIILYTSKFWLSYGLWNKDSNYHYTQGVNLVYISGEYTFEFLNPKKVR